MKNPNKSHKISINNNFIDSAVLDWSICQLEIDFLLFVGEFADLGLNLEQLFRVRSEIGLKCTGSGVDVAQFELYYGN